MTSTRVSRSQGTATAAKNSSGDSPSPPGSQDSEEGKDRVSKLAEHMKKEVGTLFGLYSFRKHRLTFSLDARTPREAQD